MVDSNGPCSQVSMYYFSSYRYIIDYHSLVITPSIDCETSASQVIGFARLSFVLKGLKPVLYSANLHCMYSTNISIKVYNNQTKCTQKSTNRNLYQLHSHPSGVGCTVGSCTKPAIPLFHSSTLRYGNILTERIS